MPDALQPISPLEKVEKILNGCTIPDVQGETIRRLFRLIVGENSHSANSKLEWMLEELHFEQSITDLTYSALEQHRQILTGDHARIGNHE